MKDDIVDVDRALAILEGDAPLVPEPMAIQFVAWKRGGSAFPQIRRVIPEETFYHASKAIGKVRTRVNRQMRAFVPVDCRVCGQSFKRVAIHQRRCPTCVQAAKQYTSPNRRRGE